VRAGAIGRNALVLLCALGCASPGAPSAEAPRRSEASDLATRGWRLLAKGDAPAACSAFDAALAQDPLDVKSTRGLAACCYSVGDYPRELVLRRRVLALAPDSAPDWTNLGHALLAKDDLMGARDAYRRALELDQQAEAARFNLGLVEQELDQPSKESPRYYEGDVPRYRDRRERRERVWLDSLR
jgi:tetratricopeptide (TPR) repeat protein